MYVSRVPLSISPSIAVRRVVFVEHVLVLPAALGHAAKLQHFAVRNVQPPVFAATFLIAETVSRNGCIVKSAVARSVHAALLDIRTPSSAIGWQFTRRFPSTAMSWSTRHLSVRYDNNSNKSPSQPIGSPPGANDRQ